MVRYVWNAFTSRLEIIGVQGPTSSTNYALTRFDGTSGNVIQNSGWRLYDNNKMLFGNVSPGDPENTIPAYINDYHGTGGSYSFLFSKNITTGNEFTVNNLGHLLTDSRIQTRDYFIAGDETFSTDYSYIEGAYGEMYSDTENTEFNFWNDKTGDFSIGLDYALDIMKIGNSVGLSGTDFLNINTDAEFGIGAAPVTGYKLAITGDTNFIGDIHTNGEVDYVGTGDLVFNNKHANTSSGFRFTYAQIGSQINLLDLSASGGANFQSFNITTTKDIFARNETLTGTLGVTGKVSIGASPVSTHQVNIDGSMQIGNAFAYTPSVLDFTMGSNSVNSRFLFGQSNSAYGGMQWNYNATAANAYLSVGNMNGINTRGFNIMQTTGWVALGHVVPTCEFDMIGDFKSSGNATIGGTSTGLSTINQGLIVNNLGGATVNDDFIAQTGNFATAIFLDASEDELNINVPLIVNDTIISDGLTLGQDEYLTIGTETLTHDGTAWQMTGDMYLVGDLSVNDLNIRSGSSITFGLSPDFIATMSAVETDYGGGFKRTSVNLNKDFYITYERVAGTNYLAMAQEDNSAWAISAVDAINSTGWGFQMLKMSENYTKPHANLLLGHTGEMEIRTTNTVGGGSIVLGFMDIESFNASFDITGFNNTTDVIEIHDENYTTPFLTEFLYDADFQGNIKFNKGVVKAYEIISTPTTLTTSHHIVEVDDGSTITLPTAVGIQGQEYNIIRSGTSNVLISTTSSQTISGDSDLTLTSQWDSVVVYSNGTNWVRGS